MLNYIEKLPDKYKEEFQKINQQALDEYFNNIKVNIPRIEDVIALSNLYKRGKECCASLRWKPSITTFETNMVAKLAYIITQIEQGKYRQKDFNQFTISERGKPRKIAALKPEDRAIQKVVNQDLLLPALQPLMVETNSASIKGKGTDWTIDNFKNNLKQHYEQYGLEGGIYQFDFSKYFESIPHNFIKDNIIKPLELDTIAQKLACDFVNDFRKLHGAKERKDSFGWRGVGLGSEVSQTIALDAATVVDKYITVIKGIKKYGRYMDDGYVISNDIHVLEEIRNDIHEITESLGLKLSDKKDRITLFKDQKYFTFLKIQYKITTTGKILMKPSKQNLKIINKRFKKWRVKLDAGIMNIEDICNSYNGWRASIMRCNNHYNILYNRDLEFIRLFRDELRHFHRPFKCYIKCIKMEDGTFEYITKEKDNIRKSKTNNNQYYRNMINNQKKKANQNKKPKETQNNGERRTSSVNQ